MTAARPHPGDPIDNLAIGRVIEVDGAHLIAELDRHVTELSRVYAGDAYPIGQFGSVIRVHYGRRIIYALVGRLRLKSEYELEHAGVARSSPDERIVEAQLLGEGEWALEGGEQVLRFQRGVATYPLPQQTVYLTPRAELRQIYRCSDGAALRIGEHVGSGGAPCYADMNELLGKHTAVLGSTGAGKSGAVAAILHGILERGAEQDYPRWNPLIVVLDPHNEYGRAFTGHLRLSTDERTLSLPYWLLSLEETLELLIGKTEFAATSQSNIVKTALLAARTDAARGLGLDTHKINVDSPIPYRLGSAAGLDEFGKLNGVAYTEGFVGAVNAQRPSNQAKKDHEDYGKVLRKRDTLMKDERMSFMMRDWDGRGDGLPAVLAQFVGTGPAVRIVDLSGVPNEVAGTASAAIARVIFSMKVWQTQAEREASPVLLVCEEAHRYVPNAGAALYAGAQEAVRRIAKEGRKYGVGLMLVSQRPSEVEATVLSQCNSWLVLRITNETDRAHVRGFLPDSMEGLTKMLSGLRRQEAIFVGQAAMLPSRVMIRDLPEGQLPKSNDIDFDAAWQSQAMDGESLSRVAQRWRYQAR